MSRPVVTELDAEGHVVFSVSDETVVIAFINEGDAAARELYSSVAERYRQDFTFGCVANAAATEAGNKKKPPSVVAYVNEEGGDKSTSIAEIRDLAGLNALLADIHPKIGELTKQNQQRLLGVSALCPILFSSL